MNVKDVKEKAKKVMDWCMRHWMFVIIAAATGYVSTIIFKAIKDDGLNAEGKPYYSEFATPKEEEDNESK